jgi:hypothetical protein
MKTTAICLILGCFFLLIACGTFERSTGREVRKETKEKRKSPIVLTAKEGNYYLNLRQNKFFDYYGKKMGVAKDELYAGVYEIKGDSLFLAFQNDYQPGDLTGKALIDRSNNQVTLFAKDPAQNRKLGIILGN